MLTGDWIWEPLCLSASTIAAYLCQFIVDDGRYNVPLPDDAAALAAALYAARFCNLPPDQEFPVWGIDVFGRELRAPLWPGGKLPCDWNERGFGHPRYTPTTWHDLVAEPDGDRPFDMIGRLRKAMAATNPGVKLSKNFIADFLAKVIPYVTGERPSAATIKQWFKQPHERKRGRRRIHP